jgi:hypothetical protein
MHLKSFLVLIFIGFVSTQRNYKKELIIGTPKIDFILKTLIDKINHVIKQIRNPLYRLTGKTFVKNFNKELEDLRFTSDEAVFNMEILINIIDPEMMTITIDRLEHLYLDHYIRNLNTELLTFSRYLDTALCILNVLYSDDDGSLLEGKPIYIRGL